MKNRIPWVRVLAEGVVIVASILLAFGIDAWWEARKDRAEEAGILVGLDAEFQEHDQQLKARELQSEHRVEDFTRILELGAGQREWPPVSTLDSLMGSLLLTPTWDPGAGEREALIASGRLELISDVELRTALAAWRSVVDEVRDGELLIRDIHRGSFLPFLASKGMPLSRAISTFSPEGVFREGPDSDLSQYRDLFQDPGFRTFVEYRLAGQIQTSGEYVSARAATDRLIDLIGSNRE